MEVIDKLHHATSVSAVRKMINRNKIRIDEDLVYKILLTIKVFH
jgi:hypothetical protein